MQPSPIIAQVYCRVEASMEARVDDQQTCGKGLAENAKLPARLASVIGALAENLELHMGTLDQTDANSRRELEAYAHLGQSFRRIAGDLAATSREMAGYRDLPMGRHDEEALANPKLLRAFEKLVREERELGTLVQQRLEGHEAMLASMRQDE
jgi:hypothetical protein